MKGLAILLIGLGLAAACSEPAKPTPAAKAPDEAAVIRVLGELNEAQTNFHHRTRRYAQEFSELVEQHLIHAEPSPDDTGYEIRMRPAADAESYTMTAAPVAPAPGARHFFTDDHGDIRAEQGKDATASSPKI